MKETREENCYQFKKATTNCLNKIKKIIINQI